ncbi:MAG: molybdopterin-dependent oxidoreductase [Pseudomonadota bacterium]
MQQRKGGGATKILYTLNTVRKIGLLNSAQALSAKNTCKACALGMGGQAGGMTNELGEFPAVCNKSVQAQSTDIQPPIPIEVFAHSVDEFRDLSAQQMEKLGRLGEPIHKSPGGNTFSPISWDNALDLATERLRDTQAQRSFFYASGRSSNEAAFLFQLFARMYGTNNVTNCSYYCHQATGVALSGTVGTGTATVELNDLGLCDTIFVIGANPASNHPRFIHQLKGCRDRGGDVIIINPAREPGLFKFALPKSPKSLLTGGSEIASDFLQPRIGGDIAVFKGIAKALLELSSEDRAFISSHTQNWDGFRADIVQTSWSQIERISGVNQDDLVRIAKIYANSKSAVFAWGMGMTHHAHGVASFDDHCPRFNARHDWSAGRWSFTAARALQCSRRGHYRR